MKKKTLVKSKTNDITWFKKTEMARYNAFRSSVTEKEDAGNEFHGLRLPEKKLLQLNLRLHKVISLVKQWGQAVNLVLRLNSCRRNT